MIELNIEITKIFFNLFQTKNCLVVGLSIHLAFENFLRVECRNQVLSRIQDDVSVYFTRALAINNLIFKLFLGFLPQTKEFF